MQPAKVAPFAGGTKLLSEKAPQATFSDVLEDFVDKTREHRCNVRLRDNRAIHHIIVQTLVMSEGVERPALVERPGEGELDERIDGRVRLLVDTFHFIVIADDFRTLPRHSRAEGQI